MIFSELYSAYYNAVARILGAILSGERDEKKLGEIVSVYAFGESMLTVLPALKNGKWQLMRADMTTPLSHAPTMPLTLLQKRWLRAILLDPRMRLFDLRIDGIEDVEPLFTEADFCVYDRYGDGDPYEDEGYIERFRTVLRAIHDGIPLSIETRNRRGKTVSRIALPERLEYSEKDDKFRLLLSDGGTVNLAKLTACKPAPDERGIAEGVWERVTDTVTLLVTDDRNSLERVMMHFAHFEKKAERIDEKTYRLFLRYDRADEAELVIRVLSFGPLVKVEAPAHFVSLIRARLLRQKKCASALTR